MAKGHHPIGSYTDNAQGLRDTLIGYDAKDRHFNFPLLSDPSLETRKYRAYDDFEQTPLHGTFDRPGRALAGNQLRTLYGTQVSAGRIHAPKNKHHEPKIMVFEYGKGDCGKQKSVLYSFKSVFLRAVFMLNFFMKTLSELRTRQNSKDVGFKD